MIGKRVRRSMTRASGRTPFFCRTWSVVVVLRERQRERGRSIRIQGIMADELEQSRAI